jgi:hypothetical protein
MISHKTWRGKFWMLSRKMFCILALLASIAGCSQKDEANPFESLLTYCISDGRCMLVDLQNAKALTGPHFQDIRGFSKQGLAMVRNHGMVGYIDSDGKPVIPLTFDAGHDFQKNGLAAVKVGEKWGLINTKGELVIAATYDELDPEGFADSSLTAVAIGDAWGYIDEKGEMLILAKYRSASAFDRYQTARVRLADSGKTLIINTKDQSIANGMQFDEARPFDTEKMAAVQFKGNFGYLNTSGEMVIMPQFDSAENFASNGLARVEANGKHGFINRKGQIVIALAYDDASSFDDTGMARVKLKGKWGFVNAQGSLRIPPVYDEVETFSVNGLAKVRLDGRSLFIDKTGKAITKETWLAAHSFSTVGLAPVQHEDKWGFINDQGKLVIPAVYDDFRGVTAQKLLYVEKADKLLYIDLAGKERLRPDFACGQVVIKDGGTIIWPQELMQGDCKALKQPIRLFEGLYSDARCVKHPESTETVIHFKQSDNGLLARESEMPCLEHAQFNPDTQGHERNTFVLVRNHLTPGDLALQFYFEAHHDGRDIRIHVFEEDRAVVALNIQKKKQKGNPEDAEAIAFLEQTLSPDGAPGLIRTGNWAAAPPSEVLAVLASASENHAVSDANAVKRQSVMPQDFSTRSLSSSDIEQARNAQSPEQAAQDARGNVLQDAYVKAYNANMQDVLDLIDAGLKGDDAVIQAQALQKFRNNEFENHIANWKRFRKEARAINDEQAQKYLSDPRGARSKLQQAIVLDPLDKEIASNLAYYTALVGDTDDAIFKVVYGMGLSRAADKTTRSFDWQLLAAMLARRGALQDSTGALYVALAISPNVNGLCRSVKNLNGLLKGPLDMPIQKMLERIESKAQPGNEDCRRN